MLTAVSPKAVGFILAIPKGRSLAYFGISQDGICRFSAHFFFPDVPINGFYFLLNI